MVDAACLAAVNLTTASHPDTTVLARYICSGDPLTSDALGHAITHLTNHPEQIDPVGGVDVFRWLVDPEPAPADMAAAIDDPTIIISLDSIEADAVAALTGATDTAILAGLKTLTNRARSKLRSNSYDDHDDVRATLADTPRHHGYQHIPTDLRAALSLDEEQLLRQAIEAELGPVSGRILDRAYDTALADLDRSGVTDPSDERRDTVGAVELLIGLTVLQLLRFLNPLDGDVVDIATVDPLDVVAAGPIAQAVLDYAGGIQIDPATGLSDTTDTGLFLPRDGTAPRPTGTGLAGPWIDQTLVDSIPQIETSKTFRWQHVTADPGRHAAAMAAGRTGDFDPHVEFDAETWADDLGRVEKLAMDLNDWPYTAVARPRSHRGCMCRVLTSINAVIPASALAA